MTFNRRREWFLLGFTGPSIGTFSSEPEIPWLTLKSIADGTMFAEDELLLRTGYVKGLYDSLGADAEVWRAAPGSDVLAAASVVIDSLSEIAQIDPVDVARDADVTNFWVGLWAATGSELALAEIIRRAKHRDGTTAAIVTSSDAMELLAAVKDHPLVGPVYARLGYDPETIGFGSFLAASAAATSVPASAAAPSFRVAFSPDAAVLETASPAAALLEGDAGAAPAAVLEGGAAVLEISSPAASMPATMGDRPSLEPAMDAGGAAADPYTVRSTAIDGPLTLSARADHDSGLVCLCDEGGVLLSMGVGSALNIINGMVAATRLLLLPAEGFIWRDDTLAPADSSMLLSVDPGLSEGMPIFHEGGPSATAERGPWIHGVIRYDRFLQSGAGYRVHVHERDGSTTSFECGPDQFEAKRLLAARIRGRVAA